jgi:sarcosine oxidase subunit beta
LPLAQAAVADWEHLADKLDAPTHYTRRGNLRLARTQDDMASLGAMVRAQSAAGLTLEMLDRDALHALAPAIAPAVLGASYCPTDGHADPHATVAAFVAAAARAGAELRFGETVVAIEAEGDRVAAVRTERGRIPCTAAVLATGVMGNDLLAPLGLEVPMAIRGVTLLRTAPAPAVLDQVIGVADASCAGRQEVDGRFRFTGSGGAWQGGTEFADAPAQQGRRPGPRLRPFVAEVARVAGLFGALVPAVLDAALDETWVGLIDSTPDALPVIEAGAGPRGLVIAMGFSGHGFCLGPVTGRICASLARGETPNLPIAPFALSRFAGAAGPAEALSLHG